MITIVLVTTVASVLATAALQVSSSSIQMTGQRKSWEQALHLAEAGATRALNMLASDAKYSTGQNATLPDTKAAVVAAAAGGAVESAREGQYTWVVPKVSGNVVYGVGYIPSRANAKQTRVVKVSYKQLPGSTPKAIVTGDRLTLTGNSSILGINGSVHSNTDLTVTGSTEIETDATASAGFTIGGSATVGGKKGGGFPMVTIPPASPSAYQHLADYDMCTGGTIRRSASATCTGPLVTTLAGNATWNGWSWDKKGRWDVNCSTAAGSSDTQAKGFFIEAADLDVVCPGGSYSWKATLITNPIGTAGAFTYGDVTMSGGGGFLQGAKDGIMIVAGRDLVMSGSPELSGTVIAQEHFHLTGANAFFGSVVAAGKVDSPGSPISDNYVAGNVKLTAQTGAPTSPPGPEPRDWQELR